MIFPALSSRAHLIAGLACASLAWSTGCSSLLGLDDFGADDGPSSAATGTSEGTVAGPGSTASTGVGAGGPSSSSGSSNDGGGGSTSTSNGGGGSTSSEGGAGGEDVALGPTVVVSSASVAQNGTTNSSRAVFLFTSDPAGSAVSYGCSLDGSAFADCTGGFDQRLLLGGARVLEVRGRDAGGTLGPILERRWTIEALGTTILALREHTIPEDTLVTISGNTRATVMVTVGAKDNIFVQDANGGFTAAALAAVSNHAIRTFARNDELPMAPGLDLVITGTYQATGGSDVIAAAAYIRGAQSAAYAPFQSNDSEEIDIEALESVFIQFGGEVPTDFNCTSCSLPAPQKCMEGCSDCNPLAYLDFSSAGTFEFGYYQGVLVGDFDRSLWFVESSEAGNDVCL